MTTYTPANLKTNPKDRARFMLGDTGILTDESGNPAWLLQDEEYQAMIDLYGFAEGVAQCADALVSRFAQEPVKFKDETGVDVDFSARVEAWNAVAGRLRAGVSKAVGLNGATPLSAPSSGPSTVGLRPDGDRVAYLWGAR